MAQILGSLVLESVEIKTAEASSTAGSDVAANLLDGDTGTIFHSASPASEWIRLTLVQPINVAEVRIINR